MITVKNGKTLQGTSQTIVIESSTDQTIDAGHLTILPAVIDVQFHLPVKKKEFQNAWIEGSQAAIAGGIGTVMEWPNDLFPSYNLASLNEKKQLIDQALAKAGSPLRYQI